ncbi:hypothetical protein BSPWISOXPB_5230 [uncultured Gammaproteobacteria bacterium]|nr:hypothetical protein BSPWISOXPB_5230 [uncultured Gammaproteobacteria bacterium]
MIRYKTGLIYGILFSMLPSIFMAISVIFEKSQYSFGFVVAILFFWSLLSISLSSIIIVIFGIPVIKILNKFNLVNSYNLVIAGGLIGLALSTNVQANDIKVLLIVSGLLGSYGFWYGGKSKHRLQKIRGRYPLK